MDLNFHHLGIATESIEKSKELYLKKGYTAGEIVCDSIQKVKVCFLKKEGEDTIELIESKCEDSPVSKLLKKNYGKDTFYHNCYEVVDLNAAILELKSMGYLLISNPVSACALENRNICFLYSLKDGLIELLSEK